MAAPGPIDVYCGLMEEIKLRVGFIQHISLNPGPVPQFTKEVCFLQLRMIHELVAIACLAAHSKHVNIGQLERQWSANEIMPRLEQLNPTFFPKAITVREGTGSALHFDEVNPQPLDKAEFLKSYGKCGGQLHRGSLRKIAAAMPAKPVSFSDVLANTELFKKLLAIHKIQAPGQTRYFCHMHGPDNGKVVVMTGLFFPDP